MDRRTFLQGLTALGASVALPALAKPLGEAKIILPATLTGTMGAGMLVVTALHHGVIQIGDRISGCGVEDTMIIAQLAGEPGEIGTYFTDRWQVVNETVLTCERKPT